LLEKDSSNINNDSFFVEGYFSLAHKSIEFNTEISKSKRKKIFCGFDKGRNCFHTVLIAQLGKFIDCNFRSNIRIDDIMSHAFDIITKASDLIVFSTLLVECRDNNKLITMYEKYGFRKFQYTQDSEHPVQMISYLH